MHPFWNWLVQFYPLWLAPNCITFAGFLLLVLKFFIFTWYDASFYASDDTHPEYLPVPNVMWLIAALCMFWAHQLDGTDGKQARRTNTSSPLGELFDHGLDSWAALLMPMGIYSVFGRGDHSIPPDHVFYVLIGIMFMFLCSHWEKYNTGVLFLPWGYDVSQLGMTGVYLVTYFGGYHFWKFRIPIIGLTSGQAFELIMHISVWCVSLPMSIYNVYASHRDKTGKNLSFYESIRPLIPVFLEFLLFLLWAHYSSVDILIRQPRIFYVAAGTIFSNISCQCVINGMSNTRCHGFNWLLVPLMGIVAGVLTMRLGVMEVYLLVAYTIFVVAAHIHFGIHVVKELADHLHIYVFSVERPPVEKIHNGVGDGLSK